MELRMEQMELKLRSVDIATELAESPTEFEDWGPRDKSAMPVDLERWVIELHSDASVVDVGNMSCHSVWYGPTSGSRAVNIGIHVLAEFRGQGIGSSAQEMLANLLHTRGIVRVEASTDVENSAEKAALARAGFVCEGVLRQAQGRADGLHDLEVWSHIV